MLIKETRKLFKGTYQYKIVLICPGSSLMRSGTYIAALDKLKSIDLATSHTFTYRIKTSQDLEYAINVAGALSSLKDCEIRVEAPFISVYTNIKSNIDTLASINEERVKYICMPPSGNLAKDVVIMPKMDYEFRITLGRTKQEHSAFIEWADKNSKVKLTKSARRDLSKTVSWGGTHFYVTGEKNILFVKMHLGDSVNKIEKIVKNI